MQTFRDIIGLWETLSDFASDAGVSYGTAQVMYHRNSIHARHWKKISEAAEARQLLGCTLADFAAIAAERPVPKPHPKQAAAHAA
jgi:hypothetical protein